MQDYEVWDGRRHISFNGVLLAESTSRTGGAPRWIEFRLYRTQAGSYVIERVGHSTVFHARGCESSPSARNGDRPVPIPMGATPCIYCRPDPHMPVGYMEEDRPWVLVTDTAHGAVEALYKHDPKTGARYFTKVVSSLLDDASEHDEEIEDLFRYETIA